MLKPNRKSQSVLLWFKTRFVHLFKRVKHDGQSEGEVGRYVYESAEFPSFQPIKPCLNPDKLIQKVCPGKFITCLKLVDKAVFPSSRNLRNNVVPPRINPFLKAVHMLGVM